MARKRKSTTLDPNELVSHPFPKKGSRKFVKRSYRDYLIDQAKDAGDKTKPAPLVSKDAKPDLTPDIDLEKAPTKEQPQGPIRDWDGKGPVKPPKGWIEIKVEYSTDEGNKTALKLSKIRERYGVDGVKWRYFSMGSHIYWVRKKYYN